MITSVNTSLCLLQLYSSQKASSFVFGDAFLPDATLVFTCISVSSKLLRRFGAPTKTPKYLLIQSGGTYFEMLRVLKHFSYGFTTWRKVYLSLLCCFGYLCVSEILLNSCSRQSVTNRKTRRERASNISHAICY